MLLPINPNSEYDKEAVKRFQVGGDVMKFAHRHQGPGNAVLDVQWSLDAPAKVSY